MEQEQQSYKEESLLELQVDYDSGNRFKEAARWGQFIAIIVFIGIGLCLLIFTFAASNIVDAFAQRNPAIAANGGILISALFVVAAIYVYIYIQLYRFATLIRVAVERQDQVTFNNALKSLKNYFLVSGVLSVLSVIWSLYSTLSTLF